MVVKEAAVAAGVAVETCVGLLALPMMMARRGEQEMEEKVVDMEVVDAAMVVDALLDADCGDVDCGDVDCGDVDCDRVACVDEVRVYGWAPDRHRHGRHFAS